MNREQKAKLIENLNATFSDAAVIVVTKQSGLTVSESSSLRNKMRENGARYQVAKNRIVKIAIKGTKYENISELFSGPTAIAFSEDPVSAPKIVSNFAKENEKLSIVGGGIDGKILSVKEIEDLGSLPSLDELRAKIVGLLTAPAQKIANLNVNVASQLVRILASKPDK